ncbi:MAG: MFS transporter [Gammaproteobacteria bacterium]|nr:MAG: MFS transporter [Gammaproteobacteria bacterium]
MISDPVGARTLSLPILIRVFLPFAFGYFLSYLYRVVNAVIAPDLVADVGLSAADLGLLTSAYFLTFALFQLPLGILLDRFGPRRTEATLLLFAAAGAFVFATATTPAMLTLGRALIGLGVSACLMAAFKAFVLWFPTERLPLVNGLQMGAGGLGALTGTAPVEAALRVIDWRGVFLTLAALTLLVAMIIFVVVPEKKTTQTTVPFADQLRGVGQVLSSRVFWHIAPWTVAVQATFLAIQGLWVGPWLRDVAALERASIGQHLALIAVSMIAGYILLGAAAERLGRRGIKPATVASFGMTAFMLLQLPIIFEWTGATLLMWAMFGFFGTTGIIPYVALSQSFPAQLAGRVITGLNLFVFLAAFAAQWAIGVLINLWPTTALGGYSARGYQVAFVVMLGLEVTGMVWYLVSAARSRAVPA